MNKCKAKIIFTTHSDREVLGDIGKSVMKQLKDIKGVSYAFHNGTECNQFGIGFSTECSIPSIHINSTEINEHMSISITESTYISLLAVRNSIAKQFTSDDIKNIKAKINKDENTLTILFSKYIPSFNIYDKGE